MHMASAALAEAGSAHAGSPLLLQQRDVLWQCQCHAQARGSLCIAPTLPLLYTTGSRLQAWWTMHSYDSCVTTYELCIMPYEL